MQPQVLLFQRDENLWQMIKVTCFWVVSADVWSLLLFIFAQGHVQVVLNMSLFGMNPQQALDAPRFCVGPGSSFHFIL